MSRRNKIIVSITGIVIILLALIGVTYGYFLNSIQGNTNANSISIAATDLSLVYSDGTDNIVLTQENISPGTTIATKTFTITNTGGSRADKYSVYLENVINDFERTEDVRIKITCTSSVKGNTCGGYDDVYPVTNALLFSNAIEAGEIHTYVMEVNYLERNIDQSVDMGKTLSGKIQIYDPNDVISISGTVTGYEDGYYVEIQSTPKTSQINSDGTYILHGVAPGTHTIYIKYIDANGAEQTVGSQEVLVKRAETAGVSGTTISITEDTIKVPIDIAVSTTSITLTIDSVIENQYEDATLVANILENAYSSQGSKAAFTASPLTTPVLNPSKAEYGYTDVYNYIKSKSANTDYYYTYSDSYTINSDGTFNLVEPTYIIKYSEGYETLKGKYIISIDGNSSSTKPSTTSLTKLYKVSDTTVSSTAFNHVKVNEYVSLENSLVQHIEDENGVDGDGNTGYYYRGGVSDNYLNFNGMCWRIVRIKEDGSVKLILEDKKNTCDSSEFRGLWLVGDTTKGYNYGYESYSTTDYTYTVANYIDGVIDDDTTENDYTNSVEYILLNWFDSSFSTDILQFMVNDEKWCLTDSTNIYRQKYETILTGYTRNTILDNNGYGVVEGVSETTRMTGFDYSTYHRLKETQSLGATLSCGDFYSGYVGLLTADEAVLAGVRAADRATESTDTNFNTGSYLINELQISTGNAFWTMSLSAMRFGTTNIEYGFVVRTTGKLNVLEVNKNADESSSPAVRPVITLKSGIKISKGDGTLSNPYVIDTSYVPE